MSRPVARSERPATSGADGPALSSSDRTAGTVGEQDPRRSYTLECTLQVLRLFTAERPSLGIAEMSHLLDVSRPTACRWASTLVVLRHLERDSKHKYRLARMSREPGMMLLQDIRLRSPSGAILHELRARTGHTVGMGFLDGDSVIYLYRLFAHREGQYAADRDLIAGARVPAHSSAIGRALLTTLPKGELNRLIRKIRLLPSTTKQTNKGLLTAINQSRKDGIATSNEDGTLSGAVPITLKHGTPQLAIEVTAPADRYPAEEFLALVAAPLHDAARSCNA